MATNNLLFLYSFLFKPNIDYMKHIYLRLAVIGLLTFAFHATTWAQRSNGLAVEGKISVEEGATEGAVIQMIQDGRRLDDYGVGSDGRYKVELNYNHKFELRFTLNGNFPQKIVVDTHIPQNIQGSTAKFPPFPVDINLFKEISGIDRSFAENTILKIFYSPQVGNFISERYYNNAQIKSLIDQAILQSQMIGKEADYLSKLTKAERAELQKEYDQLLKEADKEYGNEKFLEALDGYKAAHQIFPKEQYPQDRIAEINDLFGLIMVAEDMQTALAERFDKLLIAADQLFNSQQYLEARNSYKRALSIKPDNAYCKQRIDEINKLLERQKTEQQYQDLIVRGNNAFNEMLYQEALEIFTEALALRPNETYPKTKIAEINQKLNELAKNAENQQNYEQAMFQGELNFEKQFYDKALTSYQNALNYKPEDPKATAKIKEIEDLMSKLANQTMYDKLIKSADKAYSKKEFAAALPDYESALQLFPEEPHPAERIASIKQTLAADENFQAAIQKADAAFAQKEYEQSKLHYNEALQIRNDDKYSQDRIKEIDGILASLQLDDRYNNIITAADNLLNQKQYEQAKNTYNEALALKPKEQYPKDKIAEINAILQQIAQTNQQYQQKIAQADALFNNENYEGARPLYTEAGTIKPEETYPKEMLSKIDNLLEEQARALAEQEAAEKARLEAEAQERDKNYQNTIDEADRLASTDKLVEAVGKFRAALEIKPQEQYPITRIEEIRGMITRSQEAQKAYDEAVAKADKAYNQEAFNEAKTAYNEAKQSKPDETYPDEMIAKIDSTIQAREQLAAEQVAAEAARIAAAQAEKDSLYNAAIAKADGLFNSKDYENARTDYRAALDIKPDETYPQQRIDEIGTLLAQLSAAQKAYEDAISRADKEFKREAFNEAKTAYNEAKQAKPDETYPDEMIAKIDSTIQAREQLATEQAAAEAARIAAAQAEKDSLYNAAIAKADGLFSSKDYENARTEYRAALDVKPDETYPQQRIDEIGALLAQLSAAQKAYEDAISRADKEFKREAFNEAKTAYNEAKQAKPDETYPDEMIAKIDSTIQAREQLAAEQAAAEAARIAAAQAEKDSLYNAAIAKADGLFNSNDYENARTEYRAALDIKPDETYPQQRIDEIATLLAQLSAAQKAYEDAISRADKEFKREAFNEAKTAYNEAKQAKPDETYPDEMIAKIDSTIQAREQLAAEQAAAEAARIEAAQAEKDSLYNAAIAKADGLFNANDYENARTEYRTALDIKPDETYPKQRIDEIATLLAQLSAAQKAYEDAISRADKEFKREAFNEAKTAYNEAKQAKPDETYPDEMIAKIDSTIQAREQLAAEQAAAEAARIAAAQAEKDSMYNAAIAKADGLFNSKDYENARTEYRAALDVKPDETYPQQRIDEIGTLLAQLSAAQKTYEDAISRADKEFKREAFDEAKTAYNEAKQAKPDETYPDEMIAKIDSTIQAREQLAAEQAAAEAARIAAAQAEKDSLYNAAIAKADGLFNSKNYENARTEYRAALDVKPDETYPQQRIDEIGALLAQLYAAQKAYEDAISRADKEFKREAFNEAKTAYNEAKQAKPDETYPEKMIAKIDSTIQAREQLAAEQAAAEAARIAAAQAEKDSLYNAAIAKADGLFNSNDYENARTEYRAALVVKPDETYPQQRIDEIGTLLAQLSAAQKTYEDAISRADKEFKREAFNEAKTAYNEAKQAKPDETYPDEMIAKIDSTIQAREQLAAEQAAAEAARIAAAQAEKNSLYNAAIAKADGLFNSKDYENARTEYRAALDVKPDETYPQQRIDEIGALLAQLSAAQKTYEDAISRADKEFKREAFNEAKTAYNEAKQAKPDETYPDEMIAKIDSTIQAREQLAAEQAAAEAARIAAAQAKKDSLYNAAIAKADGLFNANDYKNARTEYRAALDVKPDETYPQQRIDEIENIILQQKLAEQEQQTRNKDYENAIAMADKYFSAKNYKEATSGYQKALDIKPEELYPKEQLARTESLLSALAQDEKYREIILAADGFFKVKSYNEAKSAYQNALGIKPEEQYPKDQISKIDDILQKEQERILAEQQAAADLKRRRNEIAEQNKASEQQEIASDAELNSLYNEYITKADGYFDNKKYNVSRAWYYKAWDVKPEETYPPERIAAINRLIRNMLSNQRDRDYQQFVDRADSTFRENQLAVARGWYNRALSVKANEDYPKSQLTEIQRLINERLAGQSGQLFNSYIEKATNAFDAQSYSVARFWYKKALDLQPDNTDVKSKLSQINEVLK